jgi:hypothetical protein
MATTAVLAPTALAADSAEFTVKTPVTVYLVTTTGGITERAKMPLLRKVGVGVYSPHDKQSGEKRKRVQLYLSQTENSMFLEDPGTYIVRKSATTQTIGVSVDDQT